MFYVNVNPAGPKLRVLSYFKPLSVIRRLILMTSCRRNTDQKAACGKSAVDLETLTDLWDLGWMEVMLVMLVFPITVLLTRPCMLNVTT